MNRRERPLGLNERAAFTGLDDLETAQLRRYVRVLLRHPLLRPGGPGGEALSGVRRNADRLQSLFVAYLGYRLVVEPTFARLYKTPRPGGGVRGAHKRSGAAFTPRGYAYLALVLAVLTGGGTQLLLSRLVSEVRAAGAEAGLEVGTGIVDRRALTAALRHLIELGVLAETDGSVAAWADDSGREALLDVDPELLGHLVAAPLGRADSPGELVTASPGLGDDRHVVRRRLVEDPVVAHADLSPGQHDWLRRNLGREAELLEDVTGLRLEARADGVLAVDPDGYLTDRAFPGPGTVERVALLTLAELFDDAPGTPAVGTEPSAKEPAARAPGATVVDTARFTAAVTVIAQRYPQAWSREAVRDPGQLARSVLRALSESGLARVLPGSLVAISPAAGRYLPVLDAPEEEGSPAEQDPSPAPLDDGQESLFSF
ncbi:TIGR02678 family protein [Nocardiopsis ansamitocini]|uniref:TIGR02678 family protein n=1 Tax=Nocardiopsis ansamitocini TaxID=1670832 RepID=A0A9W6P2Y2_9ACTN|nr:TIGR02678 family protein [Nocardiopsis ansamitocini]GLU46181.1 hypothetical protein Nans01_05320 [Nocardiopsis ansamitocini]